MLWVVRAGSTRSFGAKGARGWFPPVPAAPAGSAGSKAAPLDVALRHVTSRHVMSRHVMSCRVLSRCVVLRRVASCYLLSHRIMVDVSQIRATHQSDTTRAYTHTYSHTTHILTAHSPTTRLMRSRSSVVRSWLLSRPLPTHVFNLNFTCGVIPMFLSICILRKSIICKNL